MFRSYTETLKKMHFDMHTPKAVNNVGEWLDVKEFVKLIKLSKTQSVTWFAHCAYGASYYPSKYLIPHKSLKRDIFKEVSQALKKEGIDTTAYFACCFFSIDAFKKYPYEDWISKDESGKNRVLQRGEDMGFDPCITAGFLTDVLQNAILECATNYDINGVWLDGLYHYINRPCHCERCKAKFAKDTGGAKFEGRALNRWVTDQIWQFMNSTALKLKEIDERLTISCDTIGCLRWSIAVPEHAGFITYDPQTDNSSFNFALELAATCWRGKACDMNIERMNRWNDYNCRSQETMYTDVAVCAAMNCLFVTGDIISSSLLKPYDYSMKLIANTYDFGEKIYEKVKNIPSYSDIAILSSPEDSRVAIEKDASEGTWKVDIKKQAAIYQMVLLAGFNAHIIYDDDVEKVSQKYQTIILPELEYIGKHAIKALEEFVQKGGNLIVIGDIPKALDVFDEDSKGDRSLAEKMCGLKFKEYEDVKLSYLYPIDTQAEKYFNNTLITPFYVKGKPSLVETTTANVETYTYAHAQSYQFGSLPFGDITNNPAITRNNYGKGSVTFVAQHILTYYKESGNHLCKKLMEGLICENTNAYARLSGATNAQLVTAKDENKLAVSVIIHHGDFRTSAPRVCDNVGFMANIKVRLNEKRIPKSVKSVLGDEIKYTCDKDGILLEFQPIQIYSGVVLEF